MAYSTTFSYSTLEVPRHPKAYGKSGSSVPPRICGTSAEYLCIRQYWACTSSPITVSNSILIPFISFLQLANFCPNNNINQSWYQNKRVQLEILILNRIHPISILMFPIAVYILAQDRNCMNVCGNRHQPVIAKKPLIPRYRHSVVMERCPLCHINYGNQGNPIKKRRG